MLIKPLDFRKLLETEIKDKLKFLLELPEKTKARIFQRQFEEKVHHNLENNNN